MTFEFPENVTVPAQIKPGQPMILLFSVDGEGVYIFRDTTGQLLAGGASTGYRKLSDNELPTNTDGLNNLVNERILKATSTRIPVLS